MHPQRTQAIIIFAFTLVSVLLVTALIQQSQHPTVDIAIAATLILVNIIVINCVILLILEFDEDEWKLSYFTPVCCKYWIIVVKEVGLNHEEEALHPSGVHARTLSTHHAFDAGATAFFCCQPPHTSSAQRISHRTWTSGNPRSTARSKLTVTQSSITRKLNKKDHLPY